MRMIAQVLDNIHALAKEVEKSTRRKKRIRREHVIGAFRLARAVANGVATVVPKAIPVAVVLNGLNETIPSKKEIKDAPDSQ